MTDQEWHVFGTRLRRSRRMQDLTSQALAEKASTSRNIISALEHARKPGVSLAIVVRIAVALGVSLDYLLGRKDDETIRQPAAVA